VGNCFDAEEEGRGPIWDPITLLNVLPGVNWTLRTSVALIPYH